MEEKDIPLLYRILTETQPNAGAMCVEMHTHTHTHTVWALDSKGEKILSYRISITVKYVAERCRTLE